MSDINFEQRVEATFSAIEEAIDDSGADIDCENSSGVLTLTCEDTKSQIIVSRQVAKNEIWVAARSGGYYCLWQDQQWRCTSTQETLQQLLSRVVTEQSAAAVDLHWSLV